MQGVSLLEKNNNNNDVRIGNIVKIIIQFHGVVIWTQYTRTKMVLHVIVMCRLKVRVEALPSYEVAAYNGY
jgi:hypothetical protein